MKKALRHLLCPDVDGRYGAPMGRWETRGSKPVDEKIRDVQIPVDKQGYDPGGAYWGIGAKLRCEFTSDGTYRRYYRKG